MVRDRSSPGRCWVEPRSPGPGCGRWARGSLAGGGEGLESLAVWCQSPGRDVPRPETFRLVGRGPVNLTLPVRGSPGSPGGELPPHHGQSDNASDAGTHATRLLFEGEKEGRPGRPAPTASPGPAGTWSHWAGQFCPAPPRDLSCGGMSLFKPVSAPHPRSARSQPHPYSAPGPEGEGTMQAEGEPWDQGQGTRCFGAGSHGPGGACVASLLPMLVLLIVACPHSEMRWGSSGDPLCFCRISGSGECSGGYVPPPPTPTWCPAEMGPFLILVAASRADAGDSKNGNTSRVSGCGRRWAQLCLGLGKP